MCAEVRSGRYRRKCPVYGTWHRILEVKSLAATSKKSTSARKKTNSGRKANTGRKGNSKKQQEPEDTFTREVILWIVVAVSLLLFISNFGVGGTIGNAVSRFFFGIFGLIAYIFPIVLLVGTFFAVSNKGNKVAAVKIIASCLFVLFLCMLIELVTDKTEVKTAIEAYHYSFETKFGGGLLGGFLAHLLYPNFGMIGAYVIDIIVLIISLVLITERSALKGMQKGGKKVYESAKVSNERHRERVEQRREERELRRMDRKVEGVAIDTRILPQKPAGASEEISEIHMENDVELPDVKEEKHVTLTAKGSVTPAFSEEVLASFAEPEPQMMEPSMGNSFAEEMFVKEPSIEKPFMGEPSVEESFAGEAFSEEELPDMEQLFAAEAQQFMEPVFSEENDMPVDEVFASEFGGNGIEGFSEETDKEVSEENAVIEQPPKEYQFPPLDLLKKNEKQAGDSKKQLQETATKLQQTLKNFGVNVTITNISCGPTVTRYELQPEMGVKVSKIVNLSDDIKLNLAAADIRIEAPIPGKAAIGIEVPNKENVMVSFRELVEAEEFQSHDSKISFCVGKDIGGKVTVADIAKMPHLLIAGSTGSGKSVCINTIIMSILYKADPKDVKLIMVDPKVVELSVYNGIPHLMIPVVTDPKKAAGALRWAVAEMDDRYQKFAAANVRDLKGYNAKIESLPDVEGETKPEKMPQIVIIVDELADLMMVAAGEVEESICRLAQLARAAGIHLIIATQRPSVNVITGLIKANMPSRIAFAVTSGVDSRTILDMVGAEKLLGKGDMLFYPQGIPKPIRVQGAFVSDKEVSDVVSYIKEENGSVTYSSAVEEHMNNAASGNETVSIDSNSGGGDGRDQYFADAARLLIEKEKGSIGMLQRYFKIGFNRAARIMDQLEEAGIVGPEEGTKPRRVLMSPEQFEQYEEEYL